jgi:hypothetical protein
MKVKIQVVIESDDGRVQDVEEVACLKRGMLTPEELVACRSEYVSMA